MNRQARSTFGASGVELDRELNCLVTFCASGLGTNWQTFINLIYIPDNKDTSVSEK